MNAPGSWLAALAVLAAASSARAQPAQGEPATEPPPQEDAPPPQPTPPPAQPLTQAPAEQQVIYIVRTPNPANPPPEVPRRPPRPPRPDGSFFVGLGMGHAGPLGGDTIGGLNPGFGLEVWAGMTILPWLDASIFGQYIETSLSFPEELSSAFDENDGQLGLAGGEVRGAAGTGVLRGWASIGAATGGGTLELEASPGEQVDYEIDLGLVPVVGFGGDVRIDDRVRFGLRARWYLVTTSRVCEVAQPGQGRFGGEDPIDEYPYYYGYGYRERDEDRVRVCIDDHGEVVPDALFIGLGLSISFL